MEAIHTSRSSSYRRPPIPRSCRTRCAAATSPKRVPRTVSNAGLSGEWAQDGARRLPAVLANARPEVLILLEGINDIGSQLDLGVVRAGNAVNSMAAEGRNRNIRVILATLPPSRTGGTHAVATRLITDYNARVRSIAIGRGRRAGGSL